MRFVVVAFCILVLCAGLAACIGTGAKTSYSVDQNGILSVTCAPVTTSEKVLVTNDTFTMTRIVFHTQSGDVVTYLGAPKQPGAAIVYVPGAGEKVAGHEERMVRFAAAGYAFLFVDIRGNGAETKGYPFNPQVDFDRFENGEVPQFYETVCDISSARNMLAGRFNVPVYAAGSSNGGRYAAVAAAVDPGFAGFAGISTSGFGMASGQYTGDARRFLLSIDPDNYIGRISPRPVWIFHSKADSIIAFDEGKELFDRACKPRQFIVFYGGHGINSEVDDRLIAELEQIYGTRG